MRHAAKVKSQSRAAKGVRALPSSKTTLLAVNSYEAAQSNRRLRTWLPGSMGPNSLVSQNLDLLRSRSRDAVRNNGWIRKGVNSWVSNEIGTGIVPRAVSPDKDFNLSCDALWDRWTKRADADGILDYYGQTALSCRTRKEAGEIFIRLRERPLDFGLPVPLQLQLLEPEFCPVNENQVLQNGRKIRQGIEFDGIGRRRAYWMYRSHPGDQFFGNFDTATLFPVPADQVLHHYFPLRPGQTRGLPETIQALIAAKDFDEYEDYELIRKKTRAPYTGVIRKPLNNIPEDWNFNPIDGTSLPGKGADREIPEATLEPGSFPVLETGEDITLFSGDDTLGYAEFCRQALLRVAAGMDIPYEFLTGDLKGLNDRLMRVVRQEFHRIISQSQWHLSIPQVSQPIREAFIRMAILVGKLTAPGFADDPEVYYATAWGPQRWEYMHPVQDVQADLMEIAGGLSSQEEKVAERGGSAEDIDKQNEAAKTRQEKMGLKYTFNANALLQDPDPSGDPNATDQPGAGQ